MKAFSRTLFAVYLCILLWLVLFKFSYDPIAVLRDYQTRSLNLVPFAWARNGEMIANILAFIPFGVMLGVNFKDVAFKHKIAVIFTLSLALEAIQYSLAIGATDITDLIMNTLGGFIGLASYAILSKHTNERYLDLGILVVGIMMILAILYLRIFVFIVRY